MSWTNELLKRGNTPACPPVFSVTVSINQKIPPPYHIFRIFMANLASMRVTWMHRILIISVMATVSQGAMQYNHGGHSHVHDSRGSGGSDLVESGQTRYQISDA